MLEPDRAAVSARQRFLPVLLPGISEQDIPIFLGPTTGTHARVTDLTPAGMAPLLDVLTGRGAPASRAMRGWDRFRRVGQARGGS